MPGYEVRLTREAVKDLAKLSPKLKQKAREILENRIAVDPFSGKRLVGDLKGYFSVRLTYQDRNVYSVDEGRRMVVVHRTRTHYGE
jgi:mRNA interferase RelE/StbE